MDTVGDLSEALAITSLDPAGGVSVELGGGRVPLGWGRNCASLPG